jgi:replicative DNA helicase
MIPEKALLSLILSDNDVFYKLNPKPWWFVDHENLRVFNSIVKVLESGATADIVTVGMHAWPSLVSDVSDYISIGSNAKFYADKCKESGKIHQLKRLGKIIDDVAKNGSAEQVFTEIDTVVDMVGFDSDEYKIQKMADSLPEMIDQIEARYRAEGSLPGIKTGYERIDIYTCGLQSERLYLIGARPSEGKSALMLNMASNIGKEIPVGILSLESSIKEIMIREISSVSRIDSQKLATGYFTQSDFGLLHKAMAEINDNKIYVYDKPNLNIVEVIGQCRRMVQRYGVRVIFIDYLQLIQTGDQDDRERVSKVSKKLKALSRELKIPIVALAQLRRDSEGRRPGLGDFQHSSQLEQDADTAFLLYHRVVDESGRTLKKSEADSENESVEIYLLIEKNRDGSKGAVKMRFDKKTVTFFEEK